MCLLYTNTHTIFFTSWPILRYVTFYQCGSYVVEHWLSREQAVFIGVHYSTLTYSNCQPLSTGSIDSTFRTRCNKKGDLGLIAFYFFPYQDINVRHLEMEHYKGYNKQ